MSKWSATKVSPLDDWSDAKTLHQDKLTYCPFIPLQREWHRFSLADLRFTGIHATRVYIGLRSASEERKAGIWLNSDYWIFPDSVAARERMELEYRRGYLVRVQELPALVLSGHRNEARTPTSITPEADIAIVLTELGTDSPLEINRGNVVLQPALARLIKHATSGSLTTFEQLFKRLPPCAPPAALKAWVGNVSRLGLSMASGAAVPRPYLIYSRGYVRKEVLARVGMLNAWRAESSDIRFDETQLISTRMD